MIRVLLADDNAFVRGALVDLFTACQDMLVVAACADGDEVVPAAEATRPDVVLLDLAMPRVDGLEAARRLLAVQPDARVVFLTATASAAAAREAQAMGAVGYLLKELDPEELCECVRRVVAGHTAWRETPGTGSSGLTQTLLTDTIRSDATRAVSEKPGLWS